MVVFVFVGVVIIKRVRTKSMMEVYLYDHLMYFLSVVESSSCYCVFVVLNLVGL